MLEPGQSYRGVVLFAAPPRARPRSRRLAVLERYVPSPSLELHLAVTDLETGDRLRFGPFALSPS